MCDKIQSAVKNTMTGSFVQMEVSCSIRRLFVGKMMIDIFHRTHTCGFNGNASMIDLHGCNVITHCLFSSSSCETIAIYTASLSNFVTDIHLRLLTQVRWRHSLQSGERTGRTTWLHKQKTRRLIEGADWVSLMPEDIDVAWANWQLVPYA